MCGIVGSVGGENTRDILLEGLRRLEYRGYDSSGIALLRASEGKNVVEVVKSIGRVSALVEKTETLDGTALAGIAHTRWATHGKPSEKNAHPHTDCHRKIALVHNGIIENFRELREELSKKGHRFSSETDSEVIAHGIEEFWKKTMDFETAFREMLKRISGTYGIAAISFDEPGKIFVARMGSPLILGIGEDECLVASDASAIVGHTSRVVYLEDGEMAVVEAGRYRVKTVGNRARKKEEVELDWTEEEANREGYPHFMLKEIMEQPKSFEDAFRGRLLLDEGTARLGGLRSVERQLRSLKRIIIVSCGTSYHAGLFGEYAFEEYAGIPVEVEFASEFRYRKPILDRGTVVLAISQSGETADTLAAVREARRQGALTLGLVNVVGSTIARETDAGVYNHAGPEQSVASTKAFTSQSGILLLLALFLARSRGRMSSGDGVRMAREIHRIPKLIQKTLEQRDDIKRLVKKHIRRKRCLFLGRKYSYPIALEGALKLKEIAYVDAEGYPAGEMKHGPIALVDQDVLAIFVAPDDGVFEKSVSGIEEIRARGGNVLVITTEKGSRSLRAVVDDMVIVPKTLEPLQSLLSTIPLQLFAYYSSVERGLDVDRPRNLAKSVTVE